MQKHNRGKRVLGGDVEHGVSVTVCPQWLGKDREVVKDFGHPSA